MATITYHLNGKHIDGWDETGVEAAPLTDDDLKLAASNLTDYAPGDVLRARVEEIRPGSAITEIVHERALRLS